MDVQQKGQSVGGSDATRSRRRTSCSSPCSSTRTATPSHKSTGEDTAIPKKGDEYDYVKLADILKDAKTAYPDKNDIQVKSDDDVIYNNIIKTMDVVLSNKFPDVSLGDKGAAM